MINWNGRGAFTARIQKADVKELSEAVLDKRKLACAKCGDSVKFWITDVRAIDGPTLLQGDIKALVLCEKHGRPLQVALNEIKAMPKES